MVAVVRSCRFNCVPCVCGENYSKILEWIVLSVVVQYSVKKFCCLGKIFHIGFDMYVILIIRSHDTMKTDYTVVSP